MTHQGISKPGTQPQAASFLHVRGELSREYWPKKTDDAFVSSGENMQESFLTESRDLDIVEKQSHV